MSIEIAAAPTAGVLLGDGATNWSWISVDVTLRNTSNVTVRVGGCGPALEHETQLGGWDIEMEPMCALSAAGDIELAPGTERTLRETLPTSSTIGRWTTVAPPGRFRLLYRYWTVGRWGEADEAHSEPFELR